MIGFDGLRAHVHPGSGLVCRAPAGLLVVPSYEDRHEPTIAAMLAAVNAARGGSARPVARTLAALIAGSEPDDVPDFAFVSSFGDDDIAVLVTGDVAVSADTAEGVVRISGRDSLIWVDRVLKAPTRVIVGNALPLANDVHSDLVEGVVPGIGVSLEPRGAARTVPSHDGPFPSQHGSDDHEHLVPSTAATGPATQTPESINSAADALDSRIDAPDNDNRNGSGGVPAGPVVQEKAAAMPPAQRPPDFALGSEHVAPAREGAAQRVVVIDEPALARQSDEEPVPPSRADDIELVSLTDVPAEPREPLPLDTGDEDLAVAHAHPTEMIEGVFCKRGHFTDPDAQFCIQCGIGLYQTRNPSLGRRPELGWLVLDDGSLLHLDHDYVLGRQPEHHPDVRSGKTRGLRLRDEGGTVSRAHAMVRLRGWDVLLTDGTSRNGTQVAEPGTENWITVDRDHPFKLTPGYRIRLGMRILTYENSRGRR